MAELLESVDTMIVIPNEKLLAVAKDAGFFESFRIADDVLRQGVQGISDIITIPGIINRDFADVKTTMAGMGYAVMGTGIRGGSNRAIEAAMAAMASPLLEDGAIDGARGILINISGSSNLKLSEVNEASTLIQNAAHEDANIIFGAVLDENMGDDVKITVIATGFRGEPLDQPERRERLLNTVLNVHVPPVAFVRAESAGLAPRFASEMKEDPALMAFKSEEPKISPAIVYPAAADIAPRPAADALYGPEVERLAIDESEDVEYAAVAVEYRQIEEHPAMVASSRDQRVFSGSVDLGEDQINNEDLDVPAFVRRGGL
jgi:cell division protein FtsZ